jgi:endoglucanase
MSKTPPSPILSSILLVAFAACSQSGVPGSSTGGTKAMGGNAGSGGTPATGGSPGLGGSVGTGGRPGSGGAVGTGGSQASGGTTATGGSSSSGGTVSTGGSQASGGSSGTGGTPRSGGTVGMGGSQATGGSAATGGASSSGGIVSTGGSRASGGTVSTGGSSSSGGNIATGGSTATGGTAATGGSSSLGGTVSTGGSTGTGGTVGPAITAVQAAASMGKGFNLGQTFESTQNERSLASTSAKIDAFYAKGFRNVRIPITWTEPVGGDLLVNDAAVGDVNRTHARLAVIKQVVDYALAKPDMYVVINAHHETTLKTNSRSSVLERLWSDIADIFSGRDHRLLFEILNEPHRSDSSAMPVADLKTMTTLAYAKIRAVDPARIVVIGGNQWFGASEMATVWSNLTGVGGGQDAYLMSTFHHYDPWTFCGNGQGSYDDAWTDSNVSGPMDTMLSWANSVGKGMPVYIGEWGVAWGSRYSTMDCNNIRSWYQKLGQNASTKVIPTSVWDDNGWFKIFDLGTKAWNNNLIECVVGTCAWTGTDRFNSGCL